MRERLPATTETKNLDVVLAPTVGSALDYGVEARTSPPPVEYRYAL